MRGGKALLAGWVWGRAPAVPAGGCAFLPCPPRQPHWTPDLKWPKDTEKVQGRHVPTPAPECGVGTVPWGLGCHGHP